VEFLPTAGNDTAEYKLNWKEHPQNWDEHGQTKIIQLVQGGGKQKVTADNLNPGSTYCVRLLVDNEPGAELILDTEQVGCTPEASGGCCIIL